jgi:hypothetical protein
VVGISGEKATLGQANGPDVELVVTGTELYATYETPDGYPAVYDESRGLFCFARLVDGEYRSTGVPVTAEPPPGVERHARESDSVRARKIAQRRLQLEKRQPSAEQHNTPRSRE